MIDLTHKTLGTTMKTQAANNTEQAALKLSYLGFFVMALLGLVFAWITHSQAILLDGVYSAIAFIMVLISKRIAQLVHQPYSKDFHYGYAQFEPLVNTIRSLLILVILIFAFSSAVSALLSGGRDLKPGLALVYALLAGGGCLLMALLQRINAKKVQSPILQLDAKNWFVDGLFSLVVALGFLVAVILQSFHKEHLILYVDPILVITLAILILPIPLKAIGDSLKELLAIAPEYPAQEKIHSLLEQTLQDIGIQKKRIRMVKVGRYFFMLITLIVDKDFSSQTIKEQDKIREVLWHALKDSHPRLVLEVIVTEKEHWIDGLRFE